MSYHKVILIFLLIFTFHSCKKNEANSIKSIGENNAPGFELLDSRRTGISFINNVKNKENFNILTYRNYYNGGGVAIGDINNDGLNDIYFTSNLEKNKLYLNKGNLKFEDITEKAGVGGSRSWSTGVSFADVNGDGYMDIYVCNSGDLENGNKENEMFINNGNLTFTERGAEYGLNDVGYSTHASFFDMDLDGDLDCYLLNNSYRDPEKISFYSKERFKYGSPGGDRILQNDGKKYIDITKQSNIFSSDIDFGLGVSVGDLNNDLYPDIFVSNDFWERDYLYINQKKGKFKEDLTDNISYVSVASMGSDIGDLNNDGWQDIFSTDMLPSSNYRLKSALKFDEYFLEDLKWKNSYYYQYVQNCLHVNQKNGKFSETAYFSGVAATDWSWGALMFDMNLDGLKDIFVSNGVYHDITDNDFVDFIADKAEIKKVVSQNGRYDFRDFEQFLPHNKQKNFAFLNKGKLLFDNLANPLGLDQEGYSNGAAYGDLDNDGDYDLVVNNVNMEAFVYENKAANEAGAKYLKFKLKGSDHNPFGIGSTIKIFAGDEILISQSFTSRGFQSSVDPDLIFGLKNIKKIDSIYVIWPDLKYEKLNADIKPNTTTTLFYKDAKTIYNNPNKKKVNFNEVSGIFFDPIPVHQENNYNDYNAERLMPHVLSTQGPKIVKGDVDGDQVEDILLLGGKGQANQLYINKKSKFVKSSQKYFELDKNYESVCGALFDADGDKDLDLLVGAGGNEFSAGFDAFATRLYSNDGKGNFTKEIAAGPQVKGQIGCIKTYDFDADGDLDLFIGGRSIPGMYGLTPRSFILKNEGLNNWTDVTDQITGPIGMVTDAVWCDYNNDKTVDLVVVGEWMPITVFSYSKNKFINAGFIEGTSGWWNTLKADDIDGDGDLDFIAGNWGLNSKFQPSKERPMKMYVNDFDGNGKPEAIIEWYFQQDAKAYPFASKGDLTGQLPFLKKKTLKYKDYAKSTLTDLFPPDLLKKAQQNTVTYFGSIVIINDKGNLFPKALPYEAQLSPVFAITSADIDKDGIKDLFLGGNFYRLKPEVGRQDAFKGGYFKGMGKGEFTYAMPADNGLNVAGECRDAIWLNDALIIARNNDSVLVYKYK